jgi:hypothetical protein
VEIECEAIATHKIYFKRKERERIDDAIQVKMKQKQTKVPLAGPFPGLSQEE